MKHSGSSGTVLYGNSFRSLGMCVSVGSKPDRREETYNLCLKPSSRFYLRLEILCTSKHIINRRLEDLFLVKINKISKEKY